MIFKRIKYHALLFIIITGLTACGSGSGGSNNNDKPDKKDSNWGTMTWDKNNWS